LVFIFPSLILNFRREIFNSTARLLLDITTDIFPLTAYCEHPDCIEDSFYTYRYYLQAGAECPALYFDPLIIVGGDRTKEDPREPNYCTRCDAHHFLPGKEYTFLSLKPLGEQASAGEIVGLREELEHISHRLERSLLYRSFTERYDDPATLRSLDVPCIAERAVVFLFAEQNLLSRSQVRSLVDDLGLDEDYLMKRLADNRRPL
jgi:thymidine kinase